MARPSAYLFAGPQELLLRRAADRLLADLREEAHGDLDVTEIRATELGEQGLPDLRTASLFGGARAVVILQAQELPAEASAVLVNELDGVPPDATIVLLATGTGKIQKLAKRIKELGGRIDIEPPKDWEDAKWAAHVAAEFQRHNRAAGKDAVQAILAHAGLDVGGIAEKVAQVCATAPAGQITAEHVDAVVVGHGNRGAFAVADAMCDRDAAEALGLLRGVLDGGDDPVMVLGALAYRLRSIVAVAAGIDGKAVGLNISPGQARRLQTVRRNFGPGELTRAYRLLAEADVEIKSGVLPPDLVIERAVARIATPA